MEDRDIACLLAVFRWTADYQSKKLGGGSVWGSGSRKAFVRNETLTRSATKLTRCKLSFQVHGRPPWGRNHAPCVTWRFHGPLGGLSAFLFRERTHKLREHGAESRRPPPSRRLQAKKPFAGLRAFVRAGQTRAGQWWLLDARNRPFLSRGVNAVNRFGRLDGRAGPAGPYATAVDRRHGTADPGAFVNSVLSRLREWHVNTLAAWTSPEFFDRGPFYIETLEFRKLVPETTIKLGGAMLPDVFDPKWSEACVRWAAEICGPRRERADLIGSFTDHELGWAPAEHQEVRRQPSQNPAPSRPCASSVPRCCRSA